MTRSIDIRWIPLAKAATIALGQQITLVQNHIERIKERRDRYKPASVAYIVADLELAYWTELYEVLRANLAGKTVAPS